jgi:hypothetical protein
MLPVSLGETHSINHDDCCPLLRNDVTFVYIMIIWGHARGDPWPPEDASEQYPARLLLLLELCYSISACLLAHEVSYFLFW